MLVLGIDPGSSGAVAMYNGESLWVVDMITIKAKARGRDIVWPQIVEELASEGFVLADHCFIEKVGAMPGQGVSSMFKFGHSAGVILGWALANFISVNYVTPPVWKKYHGLIGSDKGASRSRASYLFPSYCDMFKRGKDDGRAEAALIAYYGYYKLTGDQHD